MIRFKCPHCGHGLKASEAARGRDLHCPKCSGDLVVPDKATEPDAKGDNTARGVHASTHSEAHSQRVRVGCPHCHRAFAARRSMLGKEFACPACSKAFRLPQETSKSRADTGPDKTHQQVFGSRAQRDHLPTSDARYVEVETTDGGIVQYTDIAAVRDSLLKGEITRHSKARLICREPTMEDFPVAIFHKEDERTRAYERVHRTWEEKSSWRPIGSGLAKEEAEIGLLYEPMRVCVHNGGNGATVICAAVIFIILVICAITGVFRNPSSTGTVGRAPPTPGVVGGGVMWKLLGSSRLVGIGIAIMAGLVIAAVLGLVIGYPVGAAIGYVQYLVKRDSFPRPPPDGYQDGHTMGKQILAWVKKVDSELNG